MVFHRFRFILKKKVINFKNFDTFIRFDPLSLEIDKGRRRRIETSVILQSWEHIYETKVREDAEKCFVIFVKGFIRLKKLGELGKNVQNKGNFTIVRYV